MQLAVPQSSPDTEDGKSAPRSPRPNEMFTKSQAALVGLWDSVNGSALIDPDEISLSTLLGKGVYGEVYRGECRGLTVAVKQIRAEKINEKSRLDFFRELEILSHVRHPNVVLFMGACQGDEHLAIVTEMCDHGTLGAVIKDGREPPKHNFRQRIQWAREVAIGMAWLHASKPVAIVHRDLKPDNVLLDHSWHAKVADFGLSTLTKEGKQVKEKDYLGSPLWMAPEIILGRPFGTRSDVFGFGIMLWQMCTLRSDLYPDIGTFAQFRAEIAVQGRRPSWDVPLPSDVAAVPPEVRSLAEACWAADPDTRPNFESVAAALANTLLQLDVPDLIARAFWAKKFGGAETEVEWERFQEGICHHFGFAWPPKQQRAVQLRYLRYAVGSHADAGIPCDASHPPSIVRVTDWGRLFRSFGAADAYGKWLPQLCEVLQCPWFHGDLSSEAAGRRLQGLPKGTFLVRLSATSPGVFTLSRTKGPGKAVEHRRIRRLDDGSFHMSVRKGKAVSADVSLPVFVKGHVRKPMQLRHDCPGSKYAFIAGSAPAHVDGADEYGYVEDV